MAAVAAPAPSPRPVLAEVEELRERLNAPADSGSDALLEALLEAASEQIELHAARQFHPTPGGKPEGVETRTIQLDSRFARLPDLRADEDTVILADGQPVEHCRLLARSGHPAHAIVLYQDAHELTITGRWGFSPVPPDIRHATLVWAARAFFQRQARQADVSQNPETGVASSYFARVPTVVRATLQAYRVVGL